MLSTETLLIKHLVQPVGVEVVQSFVSLIMFVLFCAISCSYHPLALSVCVTRKVFVSYFVLGVEIECLELLECCTACRLAIGSALTLGARDSFAFSRIFSNVDLILYSLYFYTDF